MSAHVGKNKTRITFTIDKDLKIELEKLSKSDNRSVSNYIINLIEHTVSNKKKNGEL